MKITDTGLTITTTGSSETNALPVPTGDRRARFVRVVSDTVAHIQFGDENVEASQNDILVTTTPQVFQVNDSTHFAVIQGTPTGGKVNLTVLRP